jgi:hypothetical protein
MQNSDTGDVALVVNEGTDAGYELARELLRMGYRVAVTGRHATELARIMHGYSASRVLALVADISDPAQFQRVIRRIRNQFCTIDLNPDQVLDLWAPSGRPGADRVRIGGGPRAVRNASHAYLPIHGCETTNNHYRWSQKQCDALAEILAEIGAL